MSGIKQMPNAPQPAPAELQLPPALPPLPDDVQERFPSLKQWKEDMDNWYNYVSKALTQLNSDTSTVINGQASQLQDLDEQVGAYAAGVVVSTGSIPLTDSTGKTYQALVK